jgi:hypothetical protein
MTNGFSTERGPFVMVDALQFDRLRLVLDKVRLLIQETEDMLWDSRGRDLLGIYDLDQANRALQAVRMEMANILTAHGVPFQRIDALWDDADGYCRRDEFSQVLSTVVHRLDVPVAALNGEGTLGDQLERYGVSQEQIANRMPDSFLEPEMAAAAVQRVWDSPEALVRETLVRWHLINGSDPVDVEAGVEQADPGTGG